jgi:hypothetical protein
VRPRGRHVRQPHRLRDVSCAAGRRLRSRHELRRQRTTERLRERSLRLQVVPSARHPVRPGGRRLRLPSRLRDMHAARDVRWDRGVRDRRRRSRRVRAADVRAAWLSRLRRAPERRLRRHDRLRHVPVGHDLCERPGVRRLRRTCSERESILRDPPAGGFRPDATGRESDSILRDARTVRRESDSTLRDARTPRRESDSILRDARTARRESDSILRDARTARRESDSIVRDARPSSVTHGRAL